MTAKIKEHNHSFMRTQVHQHRTGISQAHRLSLMFPFIFKNNAVASKIQCLYKNVKVSGFSYVKDLDLGQLY